MASLCASLEKSAKNDHTEKIVPLLEKLETEFIHVKELLDEEPWKK